MVAKITKANRKLVPLSGCELGDQIVIPKNGMVPERAGLVASKETRSIGGELVEVVTVQVLKIGGVEVEPSPELVPASMRVVRQGDAS